MRKNVFTSILIYCFFLGLILLFTHGLFQTYFEQDEWGAFGDVIYHHNLPLWSFFISKGVHFSPFGFIFWFVLYKLFALQAHYYVVVQLLLHALASFLVFILGSRLSGDKRVGLLTGILFALNGRSNQAFTHLAVFSTTVNAVIFITLFFIYLTRIKTKYFIIKNVIILFSLFLCAVFFREEGFIIIPLFISYLFLFDRVKINRKNSKAYLFLFLGLSLFLLIRIVAQSLNTTSDLGGGEVFHRTVLYNFTTLPIKFIVHNFIDANRLFFFFLDKSNTLYQGIKFNYLDVYPIFMDFANLIIFLGISLVFGLWLYFSKRTNILKYLLFACIWIVSNAAILSLVGRSIYKIDQRYVYFSSFPVLFLTSLFLVSLFSSANGRNIINTGKKVFAVILVLFLVITSYQDIQVAVHQKAFNGTARKKLLESIRTLYPTIPKNAVFYFTCQRSCYRNGQNFGIPSESVLPFSSGPGWILLVHYANGHEKTWGKFLTDSFLLDYKTEGYKKIGEYGFGYFITKKKLQEAIQKDQFPRNAVIALEYNEDTFTFRDVSEQVQETL